MGVALVLPDTFRIERLVFEHVGLGRVGLKGRPLID
jgi:hypothetical protein